MAVGRKIKERREQLGMTQAELAERMGLAKGTIGNWESELSSPKEANFTKLFEVLECDPNYLFQDYISDDEKNSPAIDAEEYKKTICDLIENIDDPNILKDLIRIVDYLIDKEGER